MSSRLTARHCQTRLVGNDFRRNKMFGFGKKYGNIEEEQMPVQVAYPVRRQAQVQKPLIGEIISAEKVEQGKTEWMKITLVLPEKEARRLNLGLVELVQSSR